MDSAEGPLTVSEAFSFYFLQVPTYHLVIEVVLLVYIVRLLLTKSPIPVSKNDRLTREEEDELIAEWQPEPLVPKGYASDRSVDDTPVITGAVGAHITVNGKDCLNMGTFNFLGFANNQSIKESAIKCTGKYGVGACGPRGFYGTIDIHLEFETKFAKFFRYEEAILYSFGYATIASVIPAYSKKNDIIYCDQGVSFPIQQGIVASRSKVKYFRHNDMDHLQSLLEEQKLQEKKNPAKARKTRKMIVAEALYLNYGDIAPMPRLVELRKQYNAPLVLDESYSFGVLGEGGRGIMEHYGLPANDVDINCVMVESALATVGGFSCGKFHIVDQQRLTGQGYCFSASLPPLQASAGLEALAIMERSPEIFNQLRNNARRMRELLKGIKGFVVCGDDCSPIIHLQLSETSDTSRVHDEETLQQIANKCIDDGVAVMRSKYLKEEFFIPPPSIRVTVMCEHSDDDLVKAAGVIKKVAESCF